MLPAPYEFDTSQLCVDPAPLLLEAVHKLSVCGVEGGEREGFLVLLGYVLRVLDFMVGLSSGLEEGENEARQGLGQAILLSSLVDNTSWTRVEPEASTSILQTVGVFLHREQNATVKEDLLSCFSVRTHTCTQAHTLKETHSPLPHQPILWDLIQRNDNSSALRVLLQVPGPRSHLVFLQLCARSIILPPPSASTGIPADARRQHPYSCDVR